MTPQEASQKLRRSMAVSIITVGVMANATVSSAVAAPEPMTLVHVHASSYSPNFAEQTFIVSWSFQGLAGSTTRSVTDSSGMNLFDSGLRGKLLRSIRVPLLGGGHLSVPFEQSDIDERHDHRLDDARPRQEDPYADLHHRVSGDALSQLS